MATHFSQIYNINNTISNDQRLVGKPSNLIARHLNNLMLFSIGGFLADCIPDISVSNRISFEEKEYNISGTAGESTFTLDTPPDNYDGAFVRIDDTSTTYTYTVNGDVLTISPALVNDSDIFASLYREGQFNADLNETEINILAEGIILGLTEEFRNASDLLDQTVYNGDARIHSQSAQMNRLNATINQQYVRRIKPMIRLYSWKFNLDRTRGISGTPSVIPSFRPNSGGN